jgi:hypothetical protein
MNLKLWGCAVKSIKILCREKIYETRSQHFFMNLSYQHTHTSNFPFESSFLYFSVSRHQQSFFLFFACPGSSESGEEGDDEEKRDAIKMKLVPKKRPKAKFYVRQPCRMCIYSLTAASLTFPRSGRIDAGKYLT